MISNWRQDLREIVDEIEPKAEKKVKETKGINNKVIINPKLSETVEAIGGELLEVKEIDSDKGDKGAKKTEEDPGLKQKEKQANMMKKRVLLQKLRAVRSGAGDSIMASHEPEGKMVESIALAANTKLQKKDDRKKKEAELRRLLNHAIAMKKGRAESVDPDGDQLDERNKSDDAFIEGETGSKTSRRNLTRAMSSTQIGMGKGARGKAEDSAKRRERHQADRGVKTKGTKAGHSGSAYPKMEKTLDDTYPHKKTARLQRKLADRKAGRKHVDDTHHSLKKKTVGEKLPKVNEGVLKFVKSIGRKKTAKKAKMDPTTDKLHDWRQKNSPEQKEREKYVSPFRPIVKEGDVHSGQGEKIQKRTKKWMDKKGQSGAPGLNAMNARTAEHKAKRGVRNPNRLVEPRDGVDSAQEVNKATRKAAFRPFNKEDKAFDYVVAKLRKQHGDGVLTKGDKMPEPSAAQQKKNAEIRAKRAKEDHRDPTEKASDGRYSDRHSNRGSD